MRPNRRLQRERGTVPTVRERRVLRRYPVPVESDAAIFAGPFDPPVPARAKQEMGIHWI